MSHFIFRRLIQIICQVRYVRFLPEASWVLPEYEASYKSSRFISVSFHSTLSCLDICTPLSVLHRSACWCVSCRLGDSSVSDNALWRVPVSQSVPERPVRPAGQGVKEFSRRSSFPTELQGVLWCRVSCFAQLTCVQIYASDHSLPSCP